MWILHRKLTLVVSMVYFGRRETCLGVEQYDAAVVLRGKVMEGQLGPWLQYKSVT